MKLSGTRQLAASQAEVWSKLNDPEVLKRSIPGCESLEKVGDNAFKGLVAVRLGPMALRFTGDVELENLDPPRSYRLKGSGKAGPAGFASGHADVRLEAKDGGTLLSYDVESNVGGKIAQLGARLIDASAAQLAGQFFDAFAAEVERPAAAAGEGAAMPAVKAPGASGVPQWLWWALAAVFVALVLYYLSLPR